MSGEQAIDRMDGRFHFDPRTLVPILGPLLAELSHRFIPDAPSYRPKVLGDFSALLWVFIGLFGALALVSCFHPALRKRLAYKSWFLGAAFVALAVYNLITLKLNLIPSLFFPAPERVIDVFITDGAFLLKCMAYSLRLLFSGYILGAIAGLATGILVGWSARWSYWVSPLIRMVGPIPSTAWIPIALVSFSSAYDASVFLIALAVWFPMTILTSSGISNVRKSYFEVSSTLGANSFHNVFRIAIPGAAPSIFTGLFNGASSSFLTLMSAEMLGCKFGIGWYINWQRETLSYPHVYAALSLMAVTFSFLISCQLKVRAWALGWQKGTIRW
jgi:NitT/TauT family transport system permease protein